MQKLVLIFLFFTFCANANPIYRWRDAQGHIHYDESKPAHDNYQQLDNTLPPVNTAVATSSPATKNSSQSKQNKKLKKTSQRKAKQVDARKNRCRRYAEQLETIANRLHAGYREPTGNRLRTKRRQLEQRVRDEC